MTTATEDQTKLADEVLARVSSDLSMITDREFRIEEVACEVATERAVGEDDVHVSFRLGFQDEDGEVTHGCVLLPLPEAISLACFLMMVPDDGVESRRERTDVDESLKDAMLEVANFVGGAADAALREALGLDVKVRSEGCQGVRADVRPALEYTDGDPLVVCRAKAAIHEYPAFELIAMLPPIGG